MPRYENFNSTGLSKTIRRLSLTFLGLTSVIFIIFLLFSVQTALTKEENRITVPIDQVVKTYKLTAEQLTKTTVTVPVSWVSESYLKEHDYSKEDKVTVESSTEKGWTLVWESDFEEGDRDGFSKAWVDGGVGCEEYPPTREDVLAHAVKDKTAPDGDYVLEIVANPKNEGGKFVNAITVRDVPFEDDHLYKVVGYFKKVPNTKLELLDMELQYINSSSVESYNSFLWYINEHNEKGYEWIIAPTKRKDEFPYQRLFKLKEDSKWHKFEFVGRYESEPKSRKVSKVIVDGKESVLNKEVPRWVHRYNDVFQVMLETHNMYTNCDPENHFIGKSRWDEIKVYKKPLKKNNRSN